MRSVGRRLRAGHRRGAGRLPDHAAGAAARLPQPGAAVASASTSTRPGWRSARSAPACTRCTGRSGHRAPSSPGERPTATSSCAWPTAAGDAAPGARRDPGRGRRRGHVPADRAAAGARRRRRRPRDVVLLLDRSGSMGGWKMVAARRAAARIVDTLTAADRFAVLAFDTGWRRRRRSARAWPTATDRQPVPGRRAPGPGGRPRRHRAARAAATRGRRACSTDPRRRDRVLVLVTDGQVGNEDQILRSAAGGAGRRAGAHGRHRPGGQRRLPRPAGRRSAAAAASWSRARTGWTRRWTTSTAGSARPWSPAVAVTADGLDLIDGTVRPGPAARRVPGRAAGRHRAVPGTRRRRAHRRRAGRERRSPGTATVDRDPVVDNPALTAIWARAHLRDLEDRYVERAGGDDAGAADRRGLAAVRRAVPVHRVRRGGQPGGHRGRRPRTG